MQFINYIVPLYDMHGNYYASQIITQSFLLAPFGTVNPTNVMDTRIQVGDQGALLQTNGILESQPCPWVMQLRRLGRCRTCSQVFESRNHLFIHLRQMQHWK